MLEVIFNFLVFDVCSKILETLGGVIDFVLGKIEGEKK